MIENFALIAQPRSGTKWLREFLNFHREIFMYGEVLFPAMFYWGFFQYVANQSVRDASRIIPENWAAMFLDYIAEISGIPAEAKRHVVGYDVKLSQVGYVPHLASVIPRHHKVLHLSRRNSLAGFVSHARLRERLGAGGDTHVRLPGQSRITLNPETIVQDVRGFIEDEASGAAAFNWGSFLHIHYEDICRDYRPGARPIREIFDFLGLACPTELPFCFSAEVTSAPTVAGDIANADAIREALSGTAYAWMLDEPAPRLPGARPTIAATAPEQPVTAPEEPAAAPEDVAAPEEPVTASEEPAAVPEDVAAPEEPVAALEEPAAAPSEVSAAAPEEPAAPPEDVAAPEEPAVAAHDHVLTSEDCVAALDRHLAAPEEPAVAPDELPAAPDENTAAPDTRIAMPEHVPA